MAEAKEKLRPIKAILETIRERADYALKELQDAEEAQATAEISRGRIRGIFEAAIKSPLVRIHFY